MKICAFTAAAALALGGAYAAAGTTSVNFASDVSQKRLASFDGTATYDSAAGKLTLVVQNTTASAKGGFLTAFAFDASGNTVAKYVDPDGGHKPNTNGFDEIRNKKGIVNATPFGKYDAGAGLDGQWMPGGVKRGIAAGASETFVFEVTGAGASSLTVADFFGGGKSGLNMVASFKGLKHNRIDHDGAIMTGAVSTLDVPAVIINTDGNTPDNNTGSGSNLPPPGDTLPPGNPPGNNPVGTTAVPVPAAAWTGLSTLALIGAGTLWRRIRARKA